MVGYPAVLMVIQSFTDYTVKNKVQGTLPNFIWFENYIALFSRVGLPRRAHAQPRPHGRADDPEHVPRHPGRRPDDAAQPVVAHPRVGRAAAGLGDAAPDGDGRVGLDLRHAVRHRQLGAQHHHRHERLDEPLVAAQPVVVLLRAHDHHRVAVGAVRRLHDLRRARPGSRRSARGGIARRRDRTQALRPHRLPVPAQRAHRRAGAADHLEPAHLHPGVRPAEPRRHRRRDQRAGHVSVPPGHRRVRHHRGASAS